MIIADKIARYKDRLCASVAIDANGCWIWQKNRARNGYGTFAYGGGKNGRAHRVSYEVFNGPIPQGLDVCHRCDVRPCVNPAHLFVGTRSENILDAATKNRVSRTHQKKGAEHPSAKLDDDRVGIILRMLKDGEPKARIARQFGVSDRVILLIDRGTLWPHVARTS
ncbi:HNH endonuclease [Mesorhizobium sp.]|uniref:HNH endonuclease n=1 Tax=Mesorhizobium sp. TaxID=1871066 RepID=UPI000FE92040|nr:HNH endonuclease [Mesorhizobium sp.]RWN33445.1 MAG: HNH endonuclease [Mesorhizobium sp.]